MAISVDAFEWIVKCNETLLTDLWQDMQHCIPCVHQANAERVFEYHHVAMALNDCISLSRQYRDGDGNLDEAAIIERMRRRYRGVNFDLAVAKCHPDLEARDEFARQRRNGR
jgi:hypothetical protein